MALETVVFQQDPFISTYECEDFYTTDDSGGVYYKESGLLGHFQHSHNHQNKNNINNNMISSPPSMVQSSTYVKGSSAKDEKDLFTTEGFFTESYPPPGKLSASGSRRKRRRVKASKNKEEVENQRMTHIAVERNRRRQMNDYLSVLRSMMPPSYAQRGDQGSIVAGAINYVKELEQHLQYMESQKLKNKKKDDQDEYDSVVFDNFFTFPQYSTRSQNDSSEASAEADIEVTMAESHANIKILSKRQPKQLFKMVSGFQSIGLTILHLNITTVDHRVLYSFNLKVEDDCQLTTVNEIATAVHEMVVMIKDEAIFC
ncbi:Transcription factor bHLH96 [Heracleum sosnowskyi]|uniref:Transcription factor bHLH96 n=1 Tax=Heracleum sosnowskyi TaxID=360622 RepID=A0AAD8H900_9APIA|nr:Transcription factor bHLH96 [Heracleum sosnowskyi]